MEWSKPKQQGVNPGPRAGHAGITVGDNWFIAGGGNNKNGTFVKQFFLYVCVKRPFLKLYFTHCFIALTRLVYGCPFELKKPKNRTASW